MNHEVALALRKLSFRIPFGKKVLQSLFRRCFKYATGVVSINDFDGDMKIDLHLSDHMQRRIFWMGFYNHEVIAVLKKIVRPGMTIFDIGANIGEITMVAAKLVGHGGSVIAFEPIDRIADSLASNVMHNNLCQVTIERLALSDQEGKREIYSSCGQDIREENCGLGSLYRTAIEQAPLQIVSLCTLDDYMQEHSIQSLDIIKIDIEGAELPCLKGAKNVLHQYKPILIVELNEETAVIAGYRQSDILDYLETFDYFFFTISRNGRLIRVVRDGNHKEEVSAFQNVLCLAREYAFLSDLLS
jgi:FkbM family methyltransferase